jgi:hypothetical protein
VPAIAAELGLPATADEWLGARGAELDQRLKRFARRLQRCELEGVELRDGRLHVTPVSVTLFLDRLSPLIRSFLGMCNLLSSLREDLSQCSCP